MRLCVGGDGEPGTCACVCVCVCVCGGGLGVRQAQVCVGVRRALCAGKVRAGAVPTAHLWTEPTRAGVEGLLRAAALPSPPSPSRGAAAGCPWRRNGGMGREACGSDGSWTLPVETAAGGRTPMELASVASGSTA